MICFIKKIHENKEGNPPSYFYKKYYENKAKMLSKSENAYISKTKKKNVYEIKKQGSKMIWVPKVKN